MTAWDLKENELGRIVGYDVSMQSMFKTRTQDLGFCEGEYIRCEKKLPFDGPIVFSLANSRLSVSKELAKQIVIEKVAKI